MLCYFLLFKPMKLEEASELYHLCLWIKAAAGPTLCSVSGEAQVHLPQHKAMASRVRKSDLQIQVQILPNMWLYAAFYTSILLLPLSLFSVDTGFWHLPK